MSLDPPLERETTLMPASPAQIAANRRNSTKSTGPSTTSGKETSRRNGLKHGLTGEGIVLPREDEDEVVSLSADLQAELRPTTKLGRLLVGRVATMAVRLEKCAKQESAATSNRVRLSSFAFEDGRLTEVEDLFAKLDADPAGVVRKLHRTPEGTFRLIQGLSTLRDKLIHSDRGNWNQYDHDRLERYAGRQTASRSSRLFRLAWAIFADCSRLEPQEGVGLDESARKAWAVGQMIELIDSEIANHRAHLESFGPNFTAVERAEAADIALFDPSKEANLARKYEAAAERGLYKALRELRQVEAEAVDQVASYATPNNAETCEELASSLPEPDSGDIEPEPGTTTGSKPVSIEPVPTPTDRLSSIPGANSRKEECPAAA
jgi:hypothetical protein